MGGLPLMKKMGGIKMKKAETIAEMIAEHKKLLWEEKENKTI